MKLRNLFRPYIFIGVGSIVFILATGVYFNWPHEHAQAISQLAPEFVRISGYINTPNGQPVTLAQQHGSVTLLHFFRIGCQECQADMPFINKMFSKYGPYGLKMIGVHSAEFDYEQKQGNVETFVNQYAIKFPVVLDQTQATFKMYNDMAWPKDVIVDRNGYIAYNHIGAGSEYDREMAIRTAMAQNATNSPTTQR